MDTHVLSAALVPETDDYITRSRENTVLTERDPRGKAVAMTCYAKIITLEDALHERAGAEDASIRESRATWIV
jgi:hypothetical protein